MNFVIFCHSLRSCWNHGNAHFLRGVSSALLAAGHGVEVYEPRDAWSVHNLVREQGVNVLDDYRTKYGELDSHVYDPDALDLEAAIDRADVVLVHEWNDPQLVSRLGQLRARRSGFRLLFHDTHHRAATAPEQMRAFDLRHYDGVLAFGGVIREIYLKQGWANQAWVWHEAADVNRFRPLLIEAPEADVIWIGNWGDEERSLELKQYLFDPVYQLELRARVHGVRYPGHALALLAERGIEYGGWMPNHLVPEAFSRHRLTVHVPRRPYAERLPGIPTIRVFEALACGIPLISGPWEDAESLFRVGTDFLMARGPEDVPRLMRDVLCDPQLAIRLSVAGLETVLSRHTCEHRASELVEICRSLGVKEHRERKVNARVA